MCNNELLAVIDPATSASATEAVYDPTGPYPPGYGNTGFSSPPPASRGGYDDIAACIRRAARQHRGKWLKVDISDATYDIAAELYRLGNIESVTEAAYLPMVNKVVGVTNYISDTGTGSVVWSWTV